MERATYQKLKNRAEILRVAEPEREDYIWGYLRGLARAHLGETYGQQDHERLMGYAGLNPVLAGNEKNSRIGQGYQDGLKAKPIGHGGPGRKAAADGAVGLMRKNITIDQQSVDALKVLGDGDLSLGIRRAAALASNQSHTRKSDKTSNLDKLDELD
jgi:hypothetical protein